MSARVLFPGRRLGKSEVARAYREACAEGGAIQTAVLAHIAGRTCAVVVDDLADGAIKLRAVDPCAIFKPIGPPREVRAEPRPDVDNGHPKRWRK